MELTHLPLPGSEQPIISYAHFLHPTNIETHISATSHLRHHPDAPALPTNAILLGRTPHFPVPSRPRLECLYRGQPIWKNLLAALSQLLQGWAANGKSN